MSTNKINVVVELFKANWCGYCVRFMPEWKNFKELAKLPNDKINFDVVAYEVTTDKELMDQVKKNKKYDFSGFPTLMITIGDNKPIKYSGNRVGTEIMDFIKKQIDNPTTQSGGGNDYDEEHYKKKYYKYKALYLKAKNNA